MVDIFSFAQLLSTPEELHPDLQDHLQERASLGHVLHHPLVIEVMFNPKFSGMVNKRYEMKKEMVAKALAVHDFSQFIYLHERPYRLEAFLEIMFKIPSDKEFWDLLGGIWIDSENIHENIDLWIELWQSNRSGRANCMDNEELRVLKKLPNRVKIYRGYNPIYPSSKEGLSWTLDEAKATWFAKRWNTNGKVTSRLVSKRNILAYFGARQESEVVIIP